MRNKNIYCCIYILINKLTNEIFYVGSTKRLLNTILHQLRFNAFNITQNAFNSKLYNYVRLMNINDGSGYYNIEIFSLEYFKCNSKIELLYRERYYIELLKPICNEVIPIKSNEEKKETKKKYTEKIICLCVKYYAKQYKLAHEKTLYHKEIIKLNFELV